jgi:signal peptidase II
LYGGANIVAKFHKLILAIVVLFCCTGFDQITKNLAREKLTAAPPISLLNDTIRIQYSEDPGAILGLGSNLSGAVRFLLFVVLNGLISITTLLYALMSHDLRVIQLAGLLLVASGGLGNLLDRLLNNRLYRN